MSRIKNFFYPGFLSPLLRKIFFSSLLTFTVVTLSQTGVSIANRILSGYMFGSEALAAMALGQPYFTICLLFSGLLSVGMQTLCTQEMAKGNIERVNNIFQSVFTLTMMVSALLTVILFVFAPETAAALGAIGPAAELQEATAAYIRGLSIGTAALILNAILIATLQIGNNGKLVIVASLVCFTSDVIFMFVFNALGMGIFGAGFATSAGNIIQLLLLLYYFIQKQGDSRKQANPDTQATPSQQLNPSTQADLKLGLRWIRLSDLKQITVLGQEKLIRRVFSILKTIILNALAASVGGTTVMAVISAASSFDTLTDVPNSGISGTVGLMTGMFYGEINEEDLHMTGVIAHRFTLLLTLILTILTLLLAKPLSMILLPDMRSDPEVMKLMMFTLICYAVRVLADTLAASRISYLRSIRRFGSVRTFQFVQSFLVIIIVNHVFARLFGVYGLLAATTVSDYISLLLDYLYFAIKTRKLRPTVRDLMALDDTCSLDPGDLLAVTIRSDDEISTTSEMLQMYCKGHGFSTAVANRAAVVLEEYAALVLAYEKNLKEQYGVDVRVVFKNDEMILRLRSQGPDFGKLNEQQEPSFRIGKLNEQQEPSFRIGKLNEQQEPSSRNRLYDKRISLAGDYNPADSENVHPALSITMIKGLAGDIRSVHTLEANNTIIRFHK